MGVALALGTGVLARWTMSWRKGSFHWGARPLFLLCLTASYSLNYAVITTVHVAVMLVLDTLYHDVQYLRWMAHYQGKQGHGQRYALKWALGCGALAFLFFHGESWSRALVGRTIPFSALILTITLYHYYVDGICWKFGRQPELAKLLSKPPPAPAEAAPRLADTGS